jgi:hypothetical protein
MNCKSEARAFEQFLREIGTGFVGEARQAVKPLLKKTPDDMSHVSPSQSEQLRIEATFDPLLVALGIRSRTYA